MSGEAKRHIKTVHVPGSHRPLWAMMNVQAYADGSLDLVALADKIGLHALDCATIIERLAQEGLMVRED
ncbi:MAG: winged helix-turn-helix domain-containing protein [Bacteroidota bacterium]